MTFMPDRAESGGAARTVDASRLSFFARMSNNVARFTGKPVTFAACCFTILIWAATGPLFHYSDTWQLIINTGTTIITFLMVFLIQNTQNRDGAALQAKLDELIRATTDARNDLVAVERLPEQAVETLREEITKAAEVERSTSSTVDVAHTAI